MTMYDAPSDRDYAEFFNPSEPEGEDPDNELPPAFDDLAAEEQWIDEQRRQEYDSVPF